MSEDKWAAQFNRDTHSKKNKKNIPLKERMEQLRSKIAHATFELFETAKKGDGERAEELYEELVKMRAKQLNQRFELLEDTFGIITDLDQDQEIEAYYKDCLRLAKATDILLEKSV